MQKALKEFEKSGVKAFLLGNTEKEQNVFLTLISLTMENNNCDKVIKNFFQGNGPEGATLWSIECQNGESYALLFHNDKLNKVSSLHCDELKNRSKARCFQKVKKA